MEKEKKKYSLISNLAYSYKGLFKICPMMRLAVAGTVFTEVGVNVLRTITMAAIMASITQNGSIKHFLLVLTAILATYLVINFLGQFIREWTGFYHENAQNREFLLRLVKKSLNIDYENVESPEKQRLLLRAQHAVNTYRYGFGMMFINTPLIIANILGTILYALTITALDYRILVVIIIMTIVNVLLDTRARRYKAGRLEEQYRIWGRFYYLKKQSTSVDNGKDIRIYSMQNWFRNGFNRLMEKNTKLNAACYKKSYEVTVSETIFTVIRDIMAYSILISQVIQGRLNIAEFTLGLGVVSGLSGWLGSIRYYVSHLLDGNRMVVEYRKMMDLPNVFLRENGESIPTLWKNEAVPEIEFRHVTFSYEEGEEILKDVNFRISPGERIALVGKNGAGKTTLVKLLCGFYHPTSGEVLINGKSIAHYNIEEYQNLFGTIFQDINILPVSIACNVSGKLEQETDIVRVQECLKKAGLWPEIEKMEKKEHTILSQSFDSEGIQLSGGMMQKLMLARCIYKNAPLLILDEPTAALDPIAESNLYQDYGKVTLGKSSLFISHRLASTKFCDRILYLEDGVIAEEGTHEELLQKEGKYAELFHIQSKYYKDGGAEDGEK